ncbi:MAG: hypothetical protein AVDCRST_MAG14-2809, partial [uncultured Rubrobacteraceae bacterium]
EQAVLSASIGIRGRGDRPALVRGTRLVGTAPRPDPAAHARGRLPPAPLHRQPGVPGTQDLPTGDRWLSDSRAPRRHPRRPLTPHSRAGRRDTPYPPGISLRGPGRDVRPGLPGVRKRRHNAYPPRQRGVQDRRPHKTPQAPLGPSARHGLTLRSPGGDAAGRPARHPPGAL